MNAFLSIRNDPHLRRYFDAVHPFFWPVLYWQLKRAWLFLQRAKVKSLLLAVTWWGSVRIVYVGDTLPGPQVHNPLAPTRPRWDDPIWSSDVPDGFRVSDFSAALQRLCLARAGGGPARVSLAPAMTGRLDST